MENANYQGYEVPINYNENYDYLTKDKQKRILKTGKYKNVLLLDMKEFQVRLREVAKEEGKKHHSLAREFIISGIKRLEKRHKKEKFIDKQYSI